MAVKDVGSSSLLVSRSGVGKYRGIIGDDVSRTPHIEHRVAPAPLCRAPHRGDRGAGIHPPPPQRDGADRLLPVLYGAVVLDPSPLPAPPDRPPLGRAPGPPPALPSRVLPVSGGFFEGWGCLPHARGCRRSSASDRLAAPWRHDRPHPLSCTHGQGRLCWVSHPLTEHRLA
jgi:hypothetical protein